MKERRKCIDCGRALRYKNPNEDCYKCRQEKTSLAKYKKLKKEFERHKELCHLTQLDLWRRLKKHEPELTWDEEPE